MTWFEFLFPLSIMNYMVSAVLAIHAYKRPRVPAIHRFAVGLFTLACVALLLLLLIPNQLPSLPAGTSVVYLAAVAFSLCSLVLYSWLQVRSILAFAAPTLSLLLLIYFFTHIPALTPHSNGELSKTVLGLHIAGAAMGQFLALGSSILSVLFLWQEKMLKEKMLRQLTANFPAMDLLGNILGISIWAGFLFLTLALCSGILYILCFFQDSQSLQNGKIIWAILVWFWYLIILVGREIMQVSTKVTAQVSLAGFLLLAIAFFGFAFLFMGDG